jgi:hypothetical protein
VSTKVDLNPVLAGPEGVTVLDARIRVASVAPEKYARSAPGEANLSAEPVDSPA